MYKPGIGNPGKDVAINQVASNQHGVISRAQALATDLTRGAILHRIEVGRWIEITSGVYRLTGAPASERSQAMAAVLAGGPDAVTTSTTALRLHGLRGFTATLAPPVVAVARRLPRKSPDGLTETFRLAPHHRTIVDGIPTATVARALFDYAATVGPTAAAHATDAALAARLVTFEQLTVVLDDLAQRGRCGTTIMRAILNERSAGYISPATVLESKFLDLIRAHTIPEPERQIDPGGLLGGDRRVDFAWSKARLVVETDGGAYHDSATDRQNDERRDKTLERAGWTVLRFSWNDVVHRPTSVINTVRRALKIAA